MDSSSLSPPSPAAQGARSYRSKTSLPAVAAAAAASSKPRKPPAGSWHFPKGHSSASKLPFPPQLKHSNLRAEFDNLQLRQNGQDAQQAVSDSEGQHLKKAQMIALLKVEGSCECLLTDEGNNKELYQQGMEESGALAKNGVHAEHGTMSTRSREESPDDNGALIVGKAAITADEGSEKAGATIAALPHESEQNPASLHENEQEENHKVDRERIPCDTENYIGPEQVDSGDLKASGRQVSELECQILENDQSTRTESLTKLSANLSEEGPGSALAETKTTVYDEESSSTSSDGLKLNAGDNDVQQVEDGLLLTSEHLDSEQEGFLFAKGEALVRETVQSSDSLPAGVDASSAKQVMEQDLTGLSQFEAALIAASDFKATISASHNTGGNSTSSMLPSELMEVAVAALAKVDVLTAKLSTMVPDQKKTFSYMPRPKPKFSRTFLSVSLVATLLGAGGLLCFVLTGVQDDQQLYLHPT
ncbi:hypothetical protein L7F22_015075 [Adiantum nelumboides]|nr:hypothetical protein [Adiantum nelumboides]